MPEVVLVCVFWFASLVLAYFLSGVAFWIDLFIMTILTVWVVYLMFGQTWRYA